MFRLPWLLLLAGWSLPALAGNPVEIPLSETCGTPIGGVLGGKVPSLKAIEGTGTIPGVLTFPRGLTSVPPEYPKSARLARISGKVILNIVVCRDGSVEGLQVLRTPSKELAEAASTAVRQWTYKPATRDGEPVAVYLPVTVDFKLNP